MAFQPPEKTKVSLPTPPKGKDFEEFVSAFFQGAGYYIERNLIERDVEEVLELDLIATNYSIVPPQIELVEVKSGEWGFTDIFKVRGWMDYLNLSKGLIIASEEKRNLNLVKKVSEGLQIGVFIIPDLADAGTAMSELLGVSSFTGQSHLKW